MIMDSSRLYGGLPVVNHLLQHTLRSICADSQWVYAVFWRILPRNYPPPKWENESGFLDRSKGNKRNWIITWEDGFCDFSACAKSAEGSEAMQPELFFKMSHEVYSYGEGLMGKVASDSSHKWIFKDPSEQEASFLSPWHGALDPQPRTWESQFKTGIQTIAIVAVQEGLLQLGSLEKVFEDLNLVIMLQRKFTYLQGIPGVFAPHPNTMITNARPRVPLASRYSTMIDDPASLGGCLDLYQQQQQHHQQHQHQRIQLTRSATFPTSSEHFQELRLPGSSEQVLVGSKRCSPESSEDCLLNNNASSSNGRMLPERPSLSKSLNTGHSPPGVQPSMSSLHALLSKLPSVSAAAAAAAEVNSSSCSNSSNGTSRPFSIQHFSTTDEEPCEDLGNSHTLTRRDKYKARDKLSSYMEPFESVEYGAEVDTYNSLFSEIIN